MQPVLSEPVEVTIQVAEDFERIGIPYLVGGSLAERLAALIEIISRRRLSCSVHPNAGSPRSPLVPPRSAAPP